MFDELRAMARPNGCAEGINWRKLALLGVADTSGPAMMFLKNVSRV